MFNKKSKNTGNDNEFYTPSIPKKQTVFVPNIELSVEQAVQQGWHFRRKARNRMKITHYTGNADDVVIPSKIGGCTVNELGGMSFQKTDIKSVQIPDTVKKLNKQCFMFCKAKTVVFTDSILVIPEEAFLCCSNLQEIYLPNYLQVIKERAFYKCRSLKFVNIPSFSSVEKEAFRYSGLEEFSLSRQRAVSVFTSENCFGNIPAQEKYKLILNPYKIPQIDYNVLLVGMRVDVKFPGGSVYLGKNSVHYGCRLDFSQCSRVLINPFAFCYERSNYGSVWSHPACQVIMPLNERSVYFPEFVDVLYADGTKYPGIFEIQNKNTDHTEIFVYGSELPPFSLRHKTKHIVLHSKNILRFYPNAVNIMQLETFKADKIRGEGTLFSPYCIRLRKVEWENNCVYIPPTELFDSNAHKQLLKAFSGKDYYCDMFDASVIENIFTQPIDSYTEFDTPHKKPQHLSQMNKILLAADVLRSTESLFPNREIYIKYLQTHKRYGKIVCSRLPEKWHEYKEFLTAFYA